MDMKFEKYRFRTCLAKHIWELKDQNKSYKISWKIIEKCKQYSSGQKFCNVCNAEKTQILMAKRNNINILNSRSEYMNHCRHSGKSLLNNVRNHKKTKKTKSTSSKNSRTQFQDENAADNSKSSTFLRSPRGRN